MGAMRATCGHEINGAWLQQGAVCVKEYSREGNKAISYRVLCPDCLANYEKAKLVLKTEGEKNRWLGLKRTRRIHGASGHRIHS